MRIYILVVIVGPLAGYANQEIGNPEDTVRYFYSQLFQSAGEQEYSKRVEHLEPVITDIFSVSTMARLTIGRQWRSLTDPQKRQFEDAMKHFIVSSFASRFKGQGHRFTIGSNEHLGSNRVIVKTKLITDQGEQADLDYQLIEENNQWHIFDIIANGVSDLAMKRSVYSTQFEAGGFESVLETIKARTEENEP